MVDISFFVPTITEPVKFTEGPKNFNAFPMLPIPFLPPIHIPKLPGIPSFVPWIPSIPLPSMPTLPPLTIPSIPLPIIPVPNLVIAPLKEVGKLFKRVGEDVKGIVTDPLGIKNVLPGIPTGLLIAGGVGMGGLVLLLLLRR